MRSDPARVRGEVVEAIPRVGRFRHPTMLPVRDRCPRSAPSPAAGAGGASGRAGRARQPRLPTRVAEPAQPLDEHGVVLLRVGGVDQAAEQLVVPGRRQTELRADRLLLRTGVPAPFRLELEDGAVAVG